ncbi:MAG: hypothetical protein COA77_03890 [Thaumarchaeota archaeon]|nr:MAG: hypothetical protein COA77_03890 [Nitrososphaerota archaeon]
MRNDERYEIQRAFDLFPHVAGSSWAVIWFRMKGIKKPTREEYREKTLEYFKKIEPIFDSFPREKEFDEINKYIENRKNEEFKKIKSGENDEVEVRYNRYVDYG